MHKRFEWFRQRSPCYVELSKCALRILSKHSRFRQIHTAPSAVTKMADKVTLGEGDFTKSQNWPQIVYGNPDKASDTCSASC